MAERDSISNRQRHFVNNSFKDFYNADELAYVLEDQKSALVASDALIGLVADEIGRDPEFLIDYLAGMPQPDIRSAYPEFSPRSGAGEWQVAVQAVLLGKEALSKTGLLTLQERKPFIFDAEGPLLQDDLHNTIVTLYDNARIDGAYAQGLLFLFEQAGSSADRIVQANARTQTRTRLKKDVALTKAFSDTKQSHDVKASLAVLNLMLKVPMHSLDGRVPGYRSMSDVMDMYVDQNKHMKPKDVDKRVQDYVAYGLNMVYAG